MHKKYAEDILRIEAQAVANLKISEDFSTAVGEILECKGRVVVTGMGKAGLVGNKIAATFASTGTPSLAVHPAEALHGDLGMITRQDIVLAISNSGETEELCRLIPAIKRIGAKVVAMTATRENGLAKLSDLTLEIGKIEEACPLGLAPSASTTAMLALGDALALTVQKERNFDREQYAMYHPGGSLGRSLMKVREVMRTDLDNPCVKPDAPVKQVLLAITKARAGAAIVINEDGRLEGIFTDGDLRRHIENGKDILNSEVSAVMTKNPICVEGGKLAVEAARIMKEKKIDELPVVDERQKVIGMLDVQDLLDIGLV